MIRGPCSTMIVGPSGCGKTSLTEALLTKGTVFQGPARPCHYCYGGVWQPHFNTIKQHGVRFHEGVLDTPDLQQWYGPTRRGVLVLDDLMEEAGHDKHVLDLFTKESHHQGITVLYLCQDLFLPGRFAKTISRNAHYIITFKNPRLFDECTKRPYGYIIIDMHLASDDRFR